MGSIGKCCCDTTCCDPLTVPSGWTLISDCCAQKVTEITEDWTTVCSDSARTDTRSASVDYLIWKTPRPDYDEPDISLVTCITDPMTGIETCSGSGGDFPPCSDEDEILCNTITESHSITTESRVVVRYKRLRQVDTLARVETACDGGASTCKWILISRMVYRVQSGQFDFIDEDYSLTDTASDTCCGAYATTTSTSDTCESVATFYEPVMTDQEVTLCRAKYFDTEPTGEYTLAPGDTIDCTPLTDPCTTLCDDEIDICSTNPDTIDWDAPTCDPYTTTIPCQVMVHYEDIFNPGIELCTLYNQGDTITIYRINIAGDLLTGAILENYLCADDCDVRPSSYYINKIECDNLTSSQSDSGYVEKCVTLSSPSWTVEI